MINITREQFFNFLKEEHHTLDKPTSPAKYYLKYFDQYQDTGRKGYWNWPAFVFGFYWFAFRKMYVYALLYFLGLMGIIIGIEISEMMPSRWMSAVVLILMFFLWFHISSRANYIYLCFASKKIAQGKEASGVSIGAFVLVCVLSLGLQQAGKFYTDVPSSVSTSYSVGGLKDLTQKAENGDAKAQYLLGAMYYMGKGVAQDYHKAYEWTSKAAEQGYADAQLMLGAMYMEGKGVLKDDKKAVEWSAKAAEQGVAKAQYNLGIMYYNGTGILQDHKKVVEWFSKAAAQGFAQAQTDLGSMYQRGLGVAQDYQKAYEWYSKAAEQGDTAAQCNLGVLYYNGRGVAQDYKKAYEWFRKAAEQGVSQAQLMLGAMYMEGIEVRKDSKQAEEWFRKAAEQGNKDAQEILQQLSH